MSHRTIQALAALALLGSPAAAQISQEQLRQRHQALLGEPFVGNANWLTDYDEARAAAAATGKPIFAYFSRSYAP